jgi:hypothetical protein
MPALQSGSSIRIHPLSVPLFDGVKANAQSECKPNNDVLHVEHATCNQIGWLMARFGSNNLLALVDTVSRNQRRAASDAQVAGVRRGSFGCKV